MCIGIIGLQEANTIVHTFLTSEPRTSNGSVWDCSWLFPDWSSIKVYETMQRGLFFYFGGGGVSRGQAKLIAKGKRAGFPIPDSEPLAFVNREEMEWSRLTEAAATAEVLCLGDGSRTHGDAATLAFADSVANNDDGGMMIV